MTGINGKILFDFRKPSQAFPNRAKIARGKIGSADCALKKGIAREEVFFAVFVRDEIGSTTRRMPGGGQHGYTDPAKIAGFLILQGFVYGIGKRRPRRAR